MSKISKVYSSDLFDANLEEVFFSMKIMKDINQARTNNQDYASRIDDLAKNIKIDTENSEPFLEFYANNKNCRIVLTKGISSFNETSDFIKNLDRKLGELEIIEDMKIILNDSEKC